jgi:hypothetical protein
LLIFSSPWGLISNVPPTYQNQQQSLSPTLLSAPWRWNHWWQWQAHGNFICRTGHWEKKVVIKKFLMWFHQNADPRGSVSPAGNMVKNKMISKPIGMPLRVDPDSHVDCQLLQGGLWERALNGTAYKPFYSLRTLMTPSWSGPTN